MSAPKQFPIQADYGLRQTRRQLRTSIPWKMIAPHEAQAISNHGQTLERLAERNGLSAAEAVAVLSGKGIMWVTRQGVAEAEAMLEQLVKAFESEEVAP